MMDSTQTIIGYVYSTRGNKRVCPRCKIVFYSSHKDRGIWCSRKCQHNSTLKERFFYKVEKTDSCWNWIGGKYSNGYGCMFVGRKLTGAHRVSWMVHNGAIPSGMQILHRCDNPPCVNPDHLFLGSQLENIRDMLGKNRGGQHKCRTVTASDVIAIRKEREETGASFKRIGEKYGFCANTAWMICTRKSWSNLP